MGAADGTGGQPRNPARPLAAYLDQPAGRGVAPLTHGQARGLCYGTRQRFWWRRICAATGPRVDLHAVAELVGEPETGSGRGIGVGGSLPANGEVM